MDTDWYGASASRGVPVRVPAFDGTKYLHCLVTVAAQSRYAVAPTDRELNSRRVDRKSYSQPVSVTLSFHAAYKASFTDMN